MRLGILSKDPRGMNAATPTDYYITPAYVALRNTILVNVRDRMRYDNQQ
jgi:hypothetical protein